MSNYDTTNLISATAAPRIPAIRVGNQVFPLETPFYKCASIDSVNHRWSGYRAVWSGSFYTYESTITVDRRYGAGFIPEIGKVYNDGALVEAKLWTGIPDDPVLYIPFASSSPSPAAETGQPLTFGGTGFNYSTVNGIACCSFSGAGYVDVNLGGTDGMPTGDLSISYWIKFLGSEWGIIYTQPGLNTNVDSAALGFGAYTEWGVSASANTAIWHHFAVTRENDIIKVYLDGVNTPESTGTQSMTVGGYTCRIGAHNEHSDAFNFTGCLAGLRVYGRALTATEIAALAAEFTPAA